MTKKRFDLRSVFSVFNEIGIISQLARAQFESCMPRQFTLPHFTVLNHLVIAGDGKTPLYLAEAFQVPKTSMTNTLSGLHRQGFVKSQPNPKDGRGKLIYITQQGRRFREKAIDSLEPAIADLAKHIDLSKLLSILPVLQELRAKMDRYR